MHRNLMVFFIIFVIIIRFILHEKVLFTIEIKKRQFIGQNNIPFYIFRKDTRCS